MNETYEITPDLRVVITPDEGTEDPRSWSPSADVLKYHVPYLDSADDLGDCQTKLGCVFTIVWGNHGDDALALTVARRYQRIFQVPEQIEIGYHTGYAQGDWYHAVAVVPDGQGTPESHLKVLADWSFGRVYTVALERAVRWIRVDDNDEPVFLADGDLRLQTWEEVESMGGVYLASEFPDRDEVLAWVREQDWDLDEEEESND